MLRVWPCFVLSCFVLLCFVLLCFVLLCFLRLQVQFSVYGLISFPPDLWSSVPELCITASSLLLRGTLRSGAVLCLVFVWMLVWTVLLFPVFILRPGLQLPVFWSCRVLCFWEFNWHFIWAWFLLQQWQLKKTWSLHISILIYHYSYFSVYCPNLSNMFR